MSSGGSNPLEDVVDFGVQRLTTGLIGFKDGKISKGVTSNMLDEGIGEMTGRNAIRKENMNNADRIEEERLARIKELQEQRERDRINDVAASVNAGSVRNASSEGTALAMAADKQLSKDFLGL